MLSDMIEDDNYAKVKGKTIIIYRTIYLFQIVLPFDSKTITILPKKNSYNIYDIIFGRKKSTTANYRNSLTIWEVMWNG